jgi:hypothetical protein
MPPQVKLIPKKCDVCSITDASKFSKCIYNICIDCKKVKNSKPYLCKYCGESESDKFPKDRYSTCKKCRANKGLESKFKEENYSNVDNKDDINKHIKKYILVDYSIFEGLTIKQVLDNQQLEVRNLNELNSKLEKENRDLKSEIFKIFCELDNLKDEIKELRNSKV